MLSENLTDSLEETSEVGGQVAKIMSIFIYTYLVGSLGFDIQTKAGKMIPHLAR